MGKRANGEGTLVKRKDKTGKTIGWKGSVTVGTLPDGTLDRRWASGKTQDEVREKLEQLKTERNTGMLTHSNKMTVGTYLEQWLEHVEPNVKYRTIKDYRRVVRQHIIPRLGAVKLDKLRVLDIERFKQQMLKEYSANACKRALLYLGMALEQAVKWQLVPRNLCSLVDRPRVTRSEMAVWEPHEVTCFLEHAQSHRLYALFELAVTVGMREGELAALKWESVDFEKGWIHVVANTSEDSEGRLVINSTPKTEKGRRKIKVSERTLELLREHRDRQQQERHAVNEPAEKVLKRRKTEKVYHDMGLVFASTGGTPLNASNIRRAFNQIIETAGVKRIRLHDLRHTAATAMIRNGYPVKIISEILGHEDPAFTLKVYTHVWDEHRHEYAPDPAELFGLQRSQNPASSLN